MANPEQQIHGPEIKHGELEKAAAERSKELKEAHAEKGIEAHKESAERALETAKAEANKEAISGRETSRSEHKPKGEETVPKVATKRTREASYKHTMKQVRQELPPASRTFSKLIHNTAVERASDVVASTIARPNAILSGSFTAILLVAGLYMLARHVGFSLSGFETILAFAIGWALGVLFDIARVAIKNKP